MTANLTVFESIQNAQNARMGLSSVCCFNDRITEAVQSRKTEPVENIILESEVELPTIGSHRYLREGESAFGAPQRRDMFTWRVGENDDVLEAISEKFLRDGELSPIEEGLYRKREGEPVTPEEQKYLKAARTRMRGDVGDPALSDEAAGIASRRKDVTKKGFSETKEGQQKRQKQASRAAAAAMKYMTDE